jgi:DNA-binding response OmpR family regulator
VSLLLTYAHEADARALVAALEVAGFDARIEPEPDGLEPADVATLDVIAMGTDGPLQERARLCRRLRAGGYLGAIVALGTAADDVGTLIDAGADDFVATPVQASELVTRVRMALRRVVARARAGWGRVAIDRVQRKAYLRDKEIPLTAREYAVMTCLLDAAGQTVSRAELLAKVWGRDTDPDSNLVEVHLSRLRDKLGADAEVIETVRRAGYRLRK